MKQAFQFNLATLLLAMGWIAISLAPLAAGFWYVTIILTTIGIGFTVGAMIDQQFLLGGLMGAATGIVLDLLVVLYVSFCTGAGWGYD